jgi:hypothetical protein
MQPSLTPQEFVDKWRGVALKERSAAQEHFIDLCRLVGHGTPAELDPQGEWFTFEAGAGKQSGGQGFADVWKRGAFAWEYKGRHVDLEAAYQQLLQYREALQNPPLLAGPGPPGAGRGGPGRLWLAARRERRGDFGAVAGAESGAGGG